MTDAAAVIVAAAIAAIAPTLAIFWSHHDTRARLVEIHDVTNGRLDKALAKIEELEKAIRELTRGR